MSNFYIDPAKELKDSKWEEIQYREAFIDIFTIDQRDEILELISHAACSKQDLREKLKRAGYLDE